MLLSALMAKVFALEVHTDGSSKDGVGSWAYVISWRGIVLAENSGQVRAGGSNPMEFHAAIEALSALPNGSRIKLFSDSKILIDAMTGGKQPPAFQDQIGALIHLRDLRRITWQWVKAHNGNPMNERCDALCVLART